MSAPEKKKGRHHAEAPAPSENIAELQSQLAQKTQEAAEYRDKMLRYAAELENLKKRQEKERADLVQYANEALIRELLPVLDNLERALEHGRQMEAAGALLEGLDLLHQGLLKALARFGVTPLASVGAKFDPAFHNAVMQEETAEAPDQTVLKELQKGYLMQNRLLRPAMVAVARNSQEAQPQIDTKV